MTREIIWKDYIMSGEYSRPLWIAINHANSKRDLRHAVYFLACRCQELESRMMELSEIVELARRALAQDGEE